MSNINNVLPCNHCKTLFTNPILLFFILTITTAFTCFVALKNSQEFLHKQHNEVIHVYLKKAAMQLKLMWTCS